MAETTTATTAPGSAAGQEGRMFDPAIQALLEMKNSVLRIEARLAECGGVKTAPEVLSELRAVRTALDEAMCGGASIPVVRGPLE